MTNMPDETERGDLEPTLYDADDNDAKFRAALEKDRQRAQHVRRNARATYRAMEGWKGVRSEEDWLEVCADSREQYESGGFFLERVGAERYLDPKLMATLLSLRQRLIAEWGITTAAEMMLLDLALHIEHQFFGQDALAENGQRPGKRPGRRFSVEEDVRRLSEQLMPLSDRANRMLIRNLKAIKELRQGLVPAIAIGRAEHVTVTNGRNGRPRRNGIERSFPERDPEPGSNL